MPTTYSGLVTHIIDIINLLIAAAFAVAFVYLIWKLIDNWVLNAGDETKQESGRQYATTAVIVMVVAISAWGIVKMIQSSIFG